MEVGPGKIGGTTNTISVAVTSVHNLIFLKLVDSVLLSQTLHLKGSNICHSISYTELSCLMQDAVLGLSKDLPSLLSRTSAFLNHQRNDDETHHRFTPTHLG